MKRVDALRVPLFMAERTKVTGPEGRHTMERIKNNSNLHTYLFQIQLFNVINFI